MFRLDQAIQNWRDRVRASGVLSADELDELEDHLRTCIDAHLTRGLDERRAFETATARMGGTRHITREYAKGHRTMSWTSKICGTALAFGLLAFVAGTNGSGASFLHVPSFLLVTGLVIGGLWSAFGPVAVLDALRAGLGGVHEGQVDRRRRALRLAVLRRGYQLSWASGVVGLIVGAILTLSNLADPAQLGPGLATCLLTVLYGALLAELVFRNWMQWIRMPAPATA